MTQDIIARGNAITEGTAHVAPLIRLVETFLAGAQAQPNLRLQLYPLRDVIPARPGSQRDWWGAFTDQDGPLPESIWEGMAHGQSTVAAMLDITDAAPLPMPQQVALAALFSAFLDWERAVPDGDSDGGPALVFAPDGSGSVFYNTEHQAPWTTFAEGITAISALPR